MRALLVGTVLVPVVDQAVKRFLGGHVRATQTRIWMMRASGGMSLRAMWGVWAAAAGVSGVVCTVVPTFAWPFGLLLGGALSHALEISLRGSVSDFVRLPFWPAFDLADVALTIGGLGLAYQVATFGA